MRDLAWVDLETTGLDPLEHEIIEIAIIRTDWRLNELRRFHALVMPLCPECAQEEALAINGFSLDRWLAEGARPLKLALEEARPYLKGASLAGHNIGNFDAVFLRQAHREHAMRTPWHWRQLDTVSLAYGPFVCGDIGGQSLAAMCDALGVINANPHSAMDDIEATIQCARVLLGL